MNVCMYMYSIFCWSLLIKYDMWQPIVKLALSGLQTKTVDTHVTESCAESLKQEYENH